MPKVMWINVSEWNLINSDERNLDISTGAVKKNYRLSCPFNVFTYTSSWLSKAALLFMDKLMRKDLVKEDSE
ncbi:hypothetical protein Smp_159080 [Schistosoma mansoni]|uniref:hypothetical protein n=1 Tax=Schistosoma mansoni TaxID=6183 RepID=UPI0001A62E0B|nr:hypothetical protein Smp_159080 [Schistosoma mansoni]|eukprot:XP_018654574.1 hypothetical protein Smp_159080 [Schistosoma mansoni]